MPLMQINTTDIHQIRSKYWTLNSKHSHTVYFVNESVHEILVLFVYRGSYMGADVLLNLLNELKKK